MGDNSVLMIETLCCTNITDAISSNLEKLSSSGNIIASQIFCFYVKNSIQQGRQCNAAPANWETDGQQR